jgi:hypothetical protein
LGEEAWADAEYGFRGQPRRFCYVSAGERECFQVSIEPPDGGQITVTAWDVETVDDAEFHWQRRVFASDLVPALEAALDQIPSGLDAMSRGEDRMPNYRVQ